MGQGGLPDKVRLTPMIERFYREESRRFVLWLPVLLGIGIWIYFSAETEPAPIRGWLFLGPMALIVSGIARRLGWGTLVLSWGLFAVTAGFGLAMFSAHRADAPQIGWPMGETVEGRVIEVSRSASGRPRLLLDRLIIYGVEPEKTPARVRLTVMGEADTIPRAGQHVRTYSSLIPVGEPAEPGAFDFARNAFFVRLGGIGLTRGHLLIVPARKPEGLSDRAFIRIAEIRDDLSRALREMMPGRQGAIAAALIVGDRAEIDEADNEALRISSLAHLLAISGLHMAILTGMVFGAARLVLAALPWTAYHLPSKKLAALIALAAGFAYLLLSGMTVPTQRAFIMVLIALMAVLLDRPAISMRSLAWAAVIVLAISPYSLLSVSFQMSFAATAALVSGYEALRRFRARRRGAGERQRARARLWRPVLLAVAYIGGLLFTSLLAGSATAPFAAWHFNRGAPYGLLANLLAVPVMGVWIAPWAAIAGVLAPFGFASPALTAMGWGIEAIMGVAHMVASLPGADQPVRAAPVAAIIVITFGGLWLALWRGWMRLAGAVALILGLGLWSSAPPRPDLLVAPGGRLIGLMGPEGRVLDHGSYHGFVAETWLRRDGDSAPQPAASARAGLERKGSRLSANFGNGWVLEVQGGRPEPAELAVLCRPRTLLIARNGDPISGPCRYYGRKELAKSGALAVTVKKDGLLIRGALDEGKGRIWSTRWRN